MLHPLSNQTWAGAVSWAAVGGTGFTGCQAPPGACSPFTVSSYLFPGLLGRIHPSDWTAEHGSQSPAASQRVSCHLCVGAPAFRTYPHPTSVSVWGFLVCHPLGSVLSGLLMGQPGEQVGRFISISASPTFGESRRVVQTFDDTDWSLRKRAPEAPEEVGVGPIGQRMTGEAGATNGPDAASSRPTPQNELLVITKSSQMKAAGKWNVCLLRESALVKWQLLKVPFNIAVQERSEEHLAGCCQVTAVQLLERTFKVESVNLANNVAVWKAPRVQNGQSVSLCRCGTLRVSSTRGFHSAACLS